MLLKAFREADAHKSRNRNKYEHVLKVWDILVANALETACKNKYLRKGVPEEIVPENHLLHHLSLRSTKLMMLNGASEMTLARGIKIWLLLQR